jgi:hypothetical protein
MSYLLDTNIISEVSKPAPDANCKAWLDANDPAKRTARSGSRPIAGFPRLTGLGLLSRRRK